MRLVVVIQARCASTRLPGKALAPICGQPLLARMLARVQLAREPDAIVVATTTDSGDDPIEALCNQLGVAVYRGHPLDCLDRHLRAGLLHNADAVVKIPSDCPLIAPEVIDRVLARFRGARPRYDYVSNLNPPSWPDGNDVEVIDLKALQAADAATDDPFEREHTTPFIVDHPERFRIDNVMRDDAEDLSQRYRWVVDWPEDLRAIRLVFEALLPSHGPGFGVDAILELYRRRPELEAINAARRGYHYRQTRSAPAHGGHTAHTKGVA